MCTLQASKHKRRQRLNVAWEAARLLSRAQDVFVKCGARKCQITWITSVQFVYESVLHIILHDSNRLAVANRRHGGRFPPGPVLSYHQTSREFR